MAEVYSWLKPLLCVKLDAKAVKSTCVGVAVDCYMNQKLGPRSEEIRGLKPWKFGYADNFIGTRAIGDKKSIPTEHGIIYSTLRNFVLLRLIIKLGKINYFREPYPGTNFG